MVTKFSPEASKVYFINQNTMFHILEGTGGIEVDFKQFHNWEDKLIFLEKGQYIKFLTEQFVIRKIEFSDEQLFLNKDFRVLFKHLISLGYINFDECDDCQKYLNSSLFSQPGKILDISSKQWFWQNPFGANNNEYHLIFDVKDIVDSHYQQFLSNDDIVRLIGQYDLNPHSLISNKLGITIKSMYARKRLIEAQRQVAFSGKSIKEIAYEFGYEDPAYFNRTFKKGTGATPGEFRHQNEHEARDSFIQHLYELIGKFHTQQRQAGFYADEMNLSIKTLSHKVRSKLNTSIGQIIRQEMIRTAKTHLLNGHPVHEVAVLLHFEEPNHFSAFFKHYTGLTPTDFIRQKVQ
ncbi:MAG: AraC family transcriptional regulator [Bacteroidota bacterium]